MLKSFFVRLCSSIVILLVYLSMYFFRDTIYLNIAISMIGVIAVFEYCRNTKIPEGRFLLYPSILYALLTPGFKNPLILTFIFIAIVFAYLIATFEKSSLLNVLSIGFMVSIIVLSLNCIVLLKDYNFLAYTLPLCLAASITDSFAYLVGVTLGKHKLAPKVSPNKSVEGAVGGTIATALAFMGYTVFINAKLSMDINLYIAFVVGVIYAVLAQMGDLSESAIKRSYSIKDFGNFIPGHGGMLDRIDSWLLTTPLVLYIAIMIGGSING